MERPNSGDLGGPDVGRGWDDVIRDGVRTAHSSLTLTAAPSKIPTGGFVNDKDAIKPSSTVEELEKITAKEIKRCLFNHGHHQTVSFVAVLDDALMNPFYVIIFEPFLAKHRALQGDFKSTPLSTLSPRELCWMEDDSDAALKQARTKEESILLLSFQQPCTQPLLLKFQPLCDPW